MSDSTRKLYLVTYVICAILCTCLIAVIFNSLRTLTTSSLSPGLILLIFLCILVLFTSSLYVLILMLGIAGLRIQLLDIRLKSEQVQQKMNSRTVRIPQQGTPVRKRPHSRFTLPEE